MSDAKLVYLDDQPEPKPQVSSSSGVKLVYVDPNATPLYTNKNKQSMGGKGPDIPEAQAFNESVGHAIPSALAMGGSFAGPGGGAAGSFIGEGLRNLSPSLFGGEQSGSVGEDVALNSLLPGLLGAVSKFASGPRQYLADKLASTMGQKIPPVANLLKASESFNSGAKSAFEQGQNKAELAYRSQIFGKDNPAVYNPDIKTPEGFTRSTFQAPEPNIDEVKDILAKASKSADKNSLASYTRRGLLLSMPAYAAGRLLGPGVTAAVGTTILVGEQGIKQLTKDPETAQLLIKAVNTPGKSEQAGLINKTLLNALRGAAVTVVNSDGDKQPAMVNDKGELVYSRQ